MRYLENRWSDKDVGLQEVPVLHQVRASDEAVATIDATIEAYFKGDKKSEVLGPFGEDGELKVYGNNIAGTKKARIRASYRDKEDPKTIKYRYDETPATAAHIDTATLCTRDEHGSADDVKPWVHVIFEDGSQIDLLAIAGAPAAKKSKSKKEEGAAVA